MVNLSGIENDMPHFLSFGEKKLVALATVLSYNPEILFLDEPSSNLDPKNRKDFIKLIKGLEKTIIIATHDLDLAYEFSNRTIVPVSYTHLDVYKRQRGMRGAAE